MVDSSFLLEITGNNVQVGGRKLILVKVSSVLSVDESIVGSIEILQVFVPLIALKALFHEKWNFVAAAGVFVSFVDRVIIQHDLVDSVRLLFLLRIVFLSALIYLL